MRRIHSRKDKIDKEKGKELTSLTASTYAAFSPDGCYIASLSLDHLHIQNPTSLTTTYTFPLDTDSAKADSFVVHWSHDSQRILLVHPQVVLVFTIGNAAGKVRIDNGSAGLGRIVDAEILDGAGGSPQAMVVWEFGRVAIWDLATGKGSELGDLKGVGKSEVRGAWGIGRTDSGGQGTCSSIRFAIRCQALFLNWSANSNERIRGMSVLY